MENASIERFIKDFNMGRISKEVFNVLIDDKIYLLPSGNYGNILALAIEMQCYVAANHIIRTDNGFNLNEIASNNKGSLSVVDVLKKAIKNRVTKEDIEKYSNNNKLIIEVLLNETALSLLVGYINTNINIKNSTSIKI